MPENPCAITDELLEAFLQCKYKARLRALGRTGQPQDIAPIAVFLASSDSGWLTGETLLASGGLR